MKKHSGFLFFKTQKIKQIKIKFPKDQSYVKCYRLVEKRKNRRNKVIIIRRRIPFKIDIGDLVPQKDDLEQLIHLTFESGVYYTHQKRTTDDHRLKDSIWDFKTK